MVFVWVDNLTMETQPTLTGRNLEEECTFTATRSSGPGGQNVNKVNTRIELRFDVNESERLSDEEKEKILLKLKNKISEDGILIVTAQDHRSQIKNKKLAIEKFYLLLESALKEKPKRKKIRLPDAVRKKRLEAKRRLSEKKKLRKPPGDV